MNVNYDELILLTGGTFLAVWGFAKMNERSRLLANGVKVIGEVSDIDTEYDYSSNSAGGKIHYPVIRFLTADNEWITQKYEIGSNPPAYDVGDKVKIIYDTADCKHFIVDDRGSRLTWPIVAVAGVTMISGVVIYFFTMQFQGF